MGPPWGALGPRPPKKSKKSSLLVLLFDHMLTPFGTFLVTVFLNVFEASLLLSFWRQGQPQASISKALGWHLGHILSKFGNVKTMIPCGRGHTNQALEGLCFSLFCHFHVQVFGTCLFQDVFDNFVAFAAFVYPFGLHFGDLWTNFLGSFFGVPKTSNDFSTRGLSPTPVAES